MDLKTIYLLIPLAPLFGAILAGLFGKTLGRVGAHSVTIGGVGIAFVLSFYVFCLHAADPMAVDRVTAYTWLTSNGVDFNIGFLVDNLTAMMMVVVTFVSLMVHIYTIGYMHDDPGYQRFFSYISLFTFAMLMLVMSDNFVQLFFGWEAVGLVSYLLIGFWFKKPTAIFANLKAFLINRVGDFGFLLGIALIWHLTGALDYQTVFARLPELLGRTVELWPGYAFPALTVVAILLFIGAMGKSAQVPLHVWLPDSMEGPTPISALIHAATMVTAGIFMVARMSPLYELSDVALNFILVIGSITALFMGILGIIQNDIKRVVAYSTLSQLGYMTVALGVSAYPVAIFHLMTHAFFKALLFLAAGSVIIGLHHEQDIRKMGGLWKYMKITWATSLIGSLALIGTPFFSGFYSKDSIIEAVHASQLPAAGFAYFAVLAGVFITAFYSFRMFFLVFHGEERFHHTGHHATHHDHHAHHGLPHESPRVVTLPLILLAIPSVLIGFFAIEPMLFGSYFIEPIRSHLLSSHEAMRELEHHFNTVYQGAFGMAFHALLSLPFWLMSAGVGLAAFLYLKRPDLAALVRARAGIVYTVLEQKYFMDHLYIQGFAAGGRALGRALWRIIDVVLIDTVLVNGSARLVGLGAQLLRRVQTGYLFHYAMLMILGALGFLVYLFREDLAINRHIVESLEHLFHFFRR